MFARSDAWVLLALIYAQRPADRDRLRFVGDYINHAIFTDDELEGRLARLRAAGHAVERDGQFAPAPPVLAWHASAKPRRDVQANLRRVEAFLGLPSDS